MLRMGKTVRAKIKSALARTGKSQPEFANSLGGKLSVNEEYTEAFRTKSYIEMIEKAQAQLGTTSIDRLSSSISLPFQPHFTEFLIEPQQETLTDIMDGLSLHSLLIEYFEASFEACCVCEALLQSIHNIRINHRKIAKAVRIAKRLRSAKDRSNEEARLMLFRELADFASRKNPLSAISRLKYRDVHDTHVDLLRRLTSKCKKMRRKAKVRRVCKKIGAFGLAFSHCALLVALLVIALHSIIGIVAAPGLLGCFLGMIRMEKNKRRRQKGSLLEKIGRQLDIAAKGTFILINDFDTISRLARRVYDEIEHRKCIAEICVRSSKGEVLKQALREFRVKEPRFLEELEELEEHVYLCIHTINKSRRSVLQEIMVSQA